MKFAGTESDRFINTTCLRVSFLKAEHSPLNGHSEQLETLINLFWLSMLQLPRCLINFPLTRDFLFLVFD